MISSTMAKYRNFSQLSQGTNSDKVNTAKAKEILQEMNAESVASKSMACTAFYKWVSNCKTEEIIICRYFNEICLDVD